MGYAPSSQIPASGSVVSPPKQLAARDSLSTDAVPVCPNLQDRLSLQKEQMMSSRMLIVTVSTFLLATACAPQSLLVDFPLLTNTPSPTFTSPAVVSTSTPIPQPVHTPTTTIQPVDCVMQGSSPAPSLPDTDCRAWEMLYSLVFMTNMMANKNQRLTASELVTLETELYPLFVQAHLNCGEWLEPYKDYEPFTDYLGFISVIGMDEYGYDPASLLLFLIEGASTEEFADMSESIGCTKNLLLLFVGYSE